MANAHALLLSNYHNICFGNVLFKCHVCNKYVLLVSLRWFSDHEEMDTIVLYGSYRYGEKKGVESCISSFSGEKGEE